LSKKPIRRINILGGAGCGKSTSSSYVYSVMKKDGYNIELVTEYVKNWAFEYREPQSFDQVYLFAKQMRQEDLILRNNIDLIITDSPLYLSICYAYYYECDYYNHLLSLAMDFEKEYPSLNILLNRANCEYRIDGRYQDLNQAITFDKFLRKFMKTENIKYKTVDFSQWEDILSIINKKVKG